MLRGVTWITLEEMTHCHLNLGREQQPLVAAEAMGEDESARDMKQKGPGPEAQEQPQLLLV